MKGKKISRSPTSAEIIAGNDDLLTEIILLRLPTKPLIKLQSVCKHWRSIISSPSFARLHTRRHFPNPQISFLLRKNPSKFFTFNPTTSKILRPFHFNSPYTRILQSCNGLLLLESRNSKYGRVNHSVYNPSTNQSRVLVFERDERVYKVFLAFDPLMSDYYRIICIYYDMVYQILDSESWKWTNIQDYNPKSLLFINTIYWKNKLNWIKQSNHMYLDLQTKKVGFAPLINTPCRKRGEIIKRHIMESNGHIHCVAVYLSPKDKCLLVYELLDDSPLGWFELHRVDLNPIAALWLEMNNNNYSVLGIVRGEIEQESCVLLHVPGKVIRYRFCDRRFEVVLDLTKCEDYEEGKLQFRDRHTIQFIESLAPV